MVNQKITVDCNKLNENEFKILLENINNAVKTTTIGHIDLKVHLCVEGYN